MFRRFKNYRIIVIVFGFIILPFAFFYIQKRVPGAKTSLTRNVLDSFFYLQKPLLYGSDKLSDFYYRYWDSVDKYDELIVLRQKADEIALLRNALIESELENDRLRGLLDFSKNIKGPKVQGASVTGRIGSPLTRMFQIDKGSSHGLDRGDGVITNAGAVGQIYALGRLSSMVLLITDASSAIDVIVERSRAHGIMRGINNEHRYLLKVKDFDRLHDIKIGDKIITSGVGAKFPSGIPIGTVTNVEYNQEGLYVEADIKPFSQFDRVEEVLVLTENNKEKPWRRKEITSFLLERSELTPKVSY